MVFRGGGGEELLFAAKGRSKPRLPGGRICAICNSRGPVSATGWGQVTDALVQHFSWIEVTNSH